MIRCGFGAAAYQNKAAPKYGGGKAEIWRREGTKLIIIWIWQRW